MLAVLLVVKALILAVTSNSAVLMSLDHHSCSSIIAIKYGRELWQKLLKHVLPLKLDGASVDISIKRPN